MKIFFQKSDSLYKIFKTIEKIQTNKEINIYIDPEHSFFDNERRGKQLKELLEEKKIEAYFITKNDRSKYFFQNLGLKIIHQEEKKLLRILNVLYLFFFSFKKFHLLAYNKKNYIFYVVFSFEVIFVLSIFYILYSLILPSWNIVLRAAQQSESIIYNFRYYNDIDPQTLQDSRFLSIPMYSWSIQYKYELSMSTSNIKYLQNPSKWQVKIINTTDKKYSFVPNTRLVTDDWRLFQTTTWTELPAATQWQYWETTVKITAMEKGEDWVFMWSRWNIPVWTRLYIKNLNQSLFLKDIYADVTQNVTWWYLSSSWTITLKDIEILSWKLSEYIVRNKKDIVSQNFEIKEWILISFIDTMSHNTKEIFIKNKVWEESPSVQWHIISNINFYYILRSDLDKWFSEYLKQRPSEKSKLITIDKNSLVFFSDIKQEWDMLIIPTKINIIQWYDFIKDTNWILENIKNQITSKNKQDAQKIILQYPEIAWVNIKIRPPRYNTLPQLKSRINFIFE